MEDSISKHKANIYLSNSFRAIEPARGAASTAGTASIAGKDRITHTIRSGETLGSIALKYGVTTNNLRDWNDLNSTRIIAGKKLIVYTNKSVGTTSPKTENTTPVAVAPANDNVIYHTVKSGDTVWGIARQYQGVSDSDILKWNNLSKTSKIKPGQKLIIMQ